MTRKLLSSAVFAGVAAAGLGLLAPTAANAATPKTVHPAYSGSVCLYPPSGYGVCISHSPWWSASVDICNVTEVANGNNWVAFEANGTYYPGTAPYHNTYFSSGVCVTYLWVDTPAG